MSLDSLQIEGGDEVLLDVQVCDICADTGREHLLAICSKCSDGAEHIYCMREPMDKLPSGDWECEECKFGPQTKGRNSAKMSFSGQANSGGNRRKLALEVGNGPAPKVLGKRQSKVVELSQGRMAIPFKRSSDMQGGKGIAAGSIGCPASETRAPELTGLSSGSQHLVSSVEVSQGGTEIPFNRSSSDMQRGKGIAAGSIGCPASETRAPELTGLSSGGRSQYREEKGPNEHQPCILDLNSPPVGDDLIVSFPVAEEEVKRSGESSGPNLELSLNI